MEYFALLVVHVVPVEPKERDIHFLVCILSPTLTLVIKDLHRNHVSKVS